MQLHHPVMVSRTDMHNKLFSFSCNYNLRFCYKIHTLNSKDITLIMKRNVLVTGIGQSFANGWRERLIISNAYWGVPCTLWICAFLSNKYSRSFIVSIPCDTIWETLVLLGFLFSSISRGLLTCILVWHRSIWGQMPPPFERPRLMPYLLHNDRGMNTDRSKLKFKLNNWENNASPFM